jgi:CBS domain-containing protein
MPTTKRSLTAADVMTREPVCVMPSTTLRELIRTLSEHEISGAPVVDVEGRLVGVVSKTDLMRRCLDEADERTPAYLVELAGADEEEQEINPERLIVVEDFMSSEPVTATPDEPVAVLAERMAGARVHRLIVIGEGEVPVGVVTSLDLLRVWRR